ncbi:biotin-dependent carboxyltransferase family protein [Aliiglaciecola sp. CAU 1673]|uniref:5-oxoprolinase subunit C family protein n=1 Tax=Aliiglaciecola sp. CAU 1673 TaxID=3032595 RepID=UPI0023DC8F67|nr:biotin-dependent carboxyltransferase family protein [Aliiglaciecola sp. CAU 1673]MDF2176669.1 biotin-dependent carboxyltransferase family protein [Aliiglaciecola sp. CAU 1673]
MNDILADAFEVLDGGLFSIVVDKGRFGFAHLGLTQGGPMDPFAYRWANRLLENNDHAQALEVSLGGLTLQARIQTRLCVTGAVVEVSVNGQPQALWQSFSVQEGDTIKLGRTRQGVRSYVAVSGGFCVAPQFGSATTVVREGIGGLHGNKLKKGDMLPAREDKQRAGWMLPPAHHPHYGQGLLLRLVPGYQYANFNQEQKQAFFTHSYRISSQADRMGYRLKGEAIAHDFKSLWSEGICLGAVQLPGDGQPIVLLHDRQTIGGYPKLGAVLSLDCARLSQCLHGTEVQFEAIPQAMAKALLLENRSQDAQLQQTLIQI